MDKIRLIHYINQFFAGIGGEEKAGISPGVKKGAVGPGQLLQSLIADKGEVVATVYCGDNYINENWDVGIREIIRIISDFNPSVVLAGPAFSSGRHGLACGGICQAVQEKLGIPAVSGMHEENPAVDQYRSKVYIAATSETARGMKEAMSVMVKLAVKLALGEPLGPAAEEGYISRGLRRNEFAAKTGAERAVDMLIRKVKKEAFVTELPLPKYDVVPSAPPIKDLSKATIALVTEGGCVPKGNPDRIESGWATKWAKYNISGLSRLSDEGYECVHGGFDTTRINEDPNRLVPLDVLADMEKEGVIGKLYNHYYVTVGAMGSIQTMKRYGLEIAKELRAAHVDGVILTAT
jgi:glycine reductase